MGVTGLWRLIEPSGKPVPLETLENKVLAVDISIWLHQALKGFHDSQGAPLPNAHLLGVYHRVCKLLYFKIKPIFVFDGGVPNLKKETISKRNQQKTKKLNEAERIQKQLLTTLLKHSAVKQVLSERAKSNLIKEANLNLEDKNNVENIYKLPPSNFDSTTSTDEEGTSETSDSSPSKQWDLHTIDEQSSHFKSLPVDIRHEILTELKETRKQSSWGRLHELPKQSGDFASYQMKRLLKRYSVQVSLEEVQKEMGGCSMSLTELETLLKDQGVVLSNDSVGSRIASDENTKYLLIKDVKKAMDIARKQQELNAKKTELENEEGKEPEVATVEEEKDEVGSLEYEKDLELAIQLSLQDVPSTSKSTLSSIQEHSFLEYVNASQNSSESEEEVYDFSTARNYMMEYSGLTSHEINKIIDNNAAKPSKSSNIQNLKRKLIYKENLVENKSTGDPIKRNHTTSDVIPMDALQKNPKKQVEMSSLEDSEELEEKSLKNKSKEIIEVGDQIKSDDAVSSLAQVELEKSKIEAVEIMSSSEDSDEFMEVCEGSSKSSGSSKLEILIKPEDVLEDDLFGDIFTDQGVSRVSEKNVEKELATKDSIQSSDHCKNERLLKQPYEGVINKQETTKHEVEAVENDKKTLNKEQNIVQKEVFNEEETDIDKEDINTIPKFVEPKQNSFLMVKESSAAIEKKKQVLTTDELEKIKSGLNQEKDELVSEMLTKNRMASNLTDQIHQEAQELLQLFGVPYIVAPMEAEAQCAFLEYIDFTNGTITDDSDIWLFGGKTVYKNFFDQRKLVMEYRSENISHNFKLNREQMILLALLVGSDYTTGLQGIGPVTALEILAAFPALKKLQSEPINDRYIVSGLQEFRKWLEENKSTGPSRIGLRNKLKNVSFIDSFPSLQVVKAYLEPAIDNSKEPFSWAKPDIPGLIEFARKKFGWSPMKSEKILEPVLKRLNEVRMQKSIKDYFSTKVIIDGKDAENKMSKRVKTAVKKIGQGDELEEDEPKKKKPARKKAASTSKADPGLLTEFEKKDKPKVKKIQSRKRKVSSTTSDISKATAGLSSDEDVQELKNVCVQSTERMEKIQDEVKRDLEQIKKKPRTTASLHKKDVIPQKEKDKLYALRSKMKAIEVFRKSKKGPGYVKKRNTLLSKIKEDAELSESSSSD